jgi:hypothetical protein
MKTTLWMIATVSAVFALASCGKKETTVRDEVSEKVGDALNTRDHEKLRDAAEDLEKDAKKAGEGLGEALKEAGEEIKKEAHKATE